jgi:hypothetical protein
MPMKVLFAITAMSEVGSGLALLCIPSAAAAGFGMGILSGPSPRDRFSMAMTFSTRSFGVATVVGATFMGRTDFLAFMAAFFLTHALLAAAAILLFRTWGEKVRSSPHSRGKVPQQPV